MIDSPPPRAPSPNAHTQPLPGAHYQNQLPISTPFFPTPIAANPIYVSALVRGFNPRSATYRSPTGGGGGPDLPVPHVFACASAGQTRPGRAKPRQNEPPSHGPCPKAKVMRAEGEKWPWHPCALEQSPTRATQLRS